METLIALGCDEDDEVVNTINTGKPRSMTDIVYRSEIFSGVKKSERVKLARMLEHAVKFVWSRTGHSDAFSLRRTLAESLEFVHVHPRLVDCVKHIHEENGEEKRISKLLSPGYSAEIGRAHV